MPDEEELEINRVPDEIRDKRLEAFAGNKEFAKPEKEELKPTTYRAYTGGGVSPIKIESVDDEFLSKPENVNYNFNNTWSNSQFSITTKFTQEQKDKWQDAMASPFIDMDKVMEDMMKGMKETQADIKKTRDELSQMAKSMKPPPPPPPPPPREFPVGSLIRDGDFGPYCPKCGSSLKRKWLLFKSEKCIEPKCENYYGRDQQSS